MLKRVHIEGFRYLVDVEVYPRPLSVLFGADPVGKSNFLEALQLLSKVVTSTTLEDAFAPRDILELLRLFAMKPEDDDSSTAEKSLSFSIEVDIQLSDTIMGNINQGVRENYDPITGMGTKRLWPDNWQPAPVTDPNLQYHIEIEMLREPYRLSVANERLIALDSEGAPIDGEIPFIERQGNKLQLRLNGRTLLDRNVPPNKSVLSMLSDEASYPHPIAARREFQSWLFFRSKPREREQVHASDALVEVHHMVPRGESLAASLNILKTDHPDRFERIVRILQGQIPSISGIEVTISDLGTAELCLRFKRNVSSTPAHVLFENALLILRTLSLEEIQNTPTLIGFEKLENSIYPARFQSVVEQLRASAALGQTQYIATTDSPNLPGSVPSESLFEVRQDNDQTRIDSPSA